MKPMLADNWVESKVRFPAILEPKIDGVRGLNFSMALTGRSLKPHANRYVTELFSRLPCYGLDGELACAGETHPDLCRITSSALRTEDSIPPVIWHCFDYITSDTVWMPYKDRYRAMARKIQTLNHFDQELGKHIKAVPFVMVRNLEEMYRQDAIWLEMGYEGSIGRDPDGLYKEGRSTANEGGLFRIKRFIEEEAIVLRVVEGTNNTNEAIINELGRTSRSSHKANLIPNGLVGKLICIDVKTGKQITVAPGKMTHAEKKLYFEHPELILQQMIKYKTFPKGVLNKPRFPTFQSFRIASDIE